MNGSRRVQKFRSAEQMQAEPPMRSEPDFDRFLRHCARFWRLAPRSYPRGVVRFQRIEDAQDARRRHTP